MTSLTQSLQKKARERFDSQFTHQIGNMPYANIPVIPGVLHDFLDSEIQSAIEAVVAEVMLKWAGDMMKVRMEFELKEGSGTGKDEMPVDYYKKLIHIMGEDVKKLSSLTQDRKDI